MVLGDNTGNTFGARSFSFGSFGSTASDTELSRLGDLSFNFKKKKNILGQRTGSRKKISESKSVRRVSQDDFEDLLDLDLFRGAGLDDVTGTSISTSKFKKSNITGETRRVSGKELSILDEAGLEQLAQVVSGRQAQIQGTGLSTGLGRQSFSLLSGNFS